MHRDDVRGIIPQPVDEGPIPRDVEGKGPRVALVVAVVVNSDAVAACLRPATADEVHGVALFLEFLAEPGAPAAVVGYRVTEGHVPDREL